MGTAANMNNAAFILEQFRDLQVVAVVTGGVEGNAGRAGDPASVVESADGFETLPPANREPGPGTINSMVLINKPLIPGAMTRTIMTATEAKSAALQESEETNGGFIDLACRALALGFADKLERDDNR